MRILVNGGEILPFALNGLFDYEELVFRITFFAYVSLLSFYLSLYVHLTEHTSYGMLHL